MNKTLKAIFLMAVMCIAMSAFAKITPFNGNVKILPPTVQHNTNRTLDDGPCIIDFIGFTYGAYTGTTSWPGHSGTYYLAMMVFTNSCTPDQLLYAYCNDLDHSLMQDPYCVNINPRVVNPAYPTQYQAMGYLMAWYPVNNALDDMIQQLSIWKLTNDELPGPWFGIPFYANPALYSLNTVNNSDPNVNDPANQHDSLALGLVDGIPRNVIMCDDQVNRSAGGGVVTGGMVTVPVTINVTRGPSAIAVGNTSLSGIRFHITTDFGVLSAADVLTDASGNAYFTLTAPQYSNTDAHITICTYGAWPKSIVACDGPGWQQLLVQQTTTGTLCEKCMRLVVPGDSWLAANLSSFDVVSGARGLELMWNSASETHLDRWEIERSATDANFSVVARVAAANVASGHSYRYEDNSVQSGVSYRYRLVDVDQNNVRTVHDNLVRTASWTGSEAVAPSTYQLFANYPNPFNPETNIRFALPASSHATLKVYDATGKEVATLVNGELPAGEHTATLHAANLPSGLYFYTFTAGNFSETRKMVLMK